MKSSIQDFGFLRPTPPLEQIWGNLRSNILDFRLYLKLFAMEFPSLYLVQINHGLNNKTKHAGAVVEQASPPDSPECLKNSLPGGVSTLGKTITVSLSILEISVSEGLRGLNATARL